MSRKHWSDLFLIAAAVCLILASVLTSYARVLALGITAFCVFVGTRARRRMVYIPGCARTAGLNTPSQDSRSEEASLEYDDDSAANELTPDVVRNPNICEAIGRQA